MQRLIARIYVVLIGIALFVAGSWPQPVLANMGPATRGGQIVAEPTGLEAIDIVHETLSIDLRPLATNDLVQVEARYEIDNRGAPRQINLVFPTGAETVLDFQVWLNETSVPSQLVMETSLPFTWQPPQQTPVLHGKQDGIYYSNFIAATTIGFSIPLASGRQSIRVRYSAEATTNVSTDSFPYYYPTRFFQFAYILAPARSWASFGGLDVTIQLPASWLAASAPLLERTDSVLTGHFATLPDDAIALTVQPPAGIFYWLLRYLGWGLLATTTFGGAFWCGRIGRTRSQAGKRPWMLALGLAVLWWLAVLLSILFVIWGPDLVIPAAQRPEHGYGPALFSMMLSIGSLVLLPIGFISIILPSRR